jgi:ABC-2 type transport system permease protein
MSVAVTLDGAASAPRTPARAPWLRVALFAVRRRRLAPLVWGLPLGALAAMVIAIFPSIESSPQLDQLLESYPEAIKQAFGITDASFASPEGYLAAELFNLIAPFACCYFAIHMLAGALCGADQRATLDVMLSAPIARRHYLAGWLVAVAVVLLGTLIELALLMQAAALAAGVELDVCSTLTGVLNLWPLALFTGGLASVLSGGLHRSVSVTGAATGLLVAMYFVEVLGRISETVARFDGLSAFHYYGSAIEDGFDPAAFLGLTAAALALAAVGCVLFERRDIRR